MSKKPITILIIEDDAVACRDLWQYMETMDDLKLVGITADSDKDIEFIRMMPSLTDSLPSRSFHRKRMPLKRTCPCI